MTRIRTAGAVLCGAAFIVALLYAVVITYATRIVFDPVVFSTRVADSLAEPRSPASSQARSPIRS
jgi:3-deoxy-D-arabino-heptulosonate 7-phosphate (DAHP) synthase class II